MKNSLPALALGLSYHDPLKNYVRCKHIWMSWKSAWQLLFPKQRVSRALIPAYKSPNGTGRNWEYKGAPSTMDSLPLKVVNRNQTTIFMYPVVCLNVFKELFETEQFTETDWIDFSEWVNFSVGFSPQNYCFHRPSFASWCANLYKDNTRSLITTRQ